MKKQVTKQTKKRKPNKYDYHDNHIALLDMDSGSEYRCPACYTTVRDYNKAKACPYCKYVPYRKATVEDVMWESLEVTVETIIPNIIKAVLWLTLIIFTQSMYWSASLDTYADNPLENNWLYLWILPNFIILAFVLYKLVKIHTIEDLIRKQLTIKELINRNLTVERAIRFIVLVWLLYFSVRTFAYTGKFVFKLIIG